MAPVGWLALSVLADIVYLDLLDANNVLGSVAAAALF